MTPRKDLLLCRDAILRVRESIEKFIVKNGYSDLDIQMDDHTIPWREFCEEVLEWLYEYGRIGKEPKGPR